MRPVRALSTLFAALLITGTAPALAQDRDWFAVGGQASTAGFGPEIMFSPSRYLTIRATGNYLSFDTSDTYSGVDYDLGVDLASAGGFLDFHPLRNGFYLSVGALYNGNEAGLSGVAPAGSNIGGITLPSAVGLAGDLTFDEFAPYVGLGWDSTFTSRSNWTFTVRAGVMYQGNASVDLRQTAGPALPPGALEREARNIEDDLADYLEFYPVISVGVNYRF